MAGSNIIDGLPSWKTSLSILVTGLIGGGKSSLTNKLLDRNDARVAKTPYRETKSVKAHHSVTYKRCSIEIWDLPGLGYGGDQVYIREMKGLGCDNADLVFSV